MKYMLLFCGTAKDDDAWAAMSEEQQAEAYGRAAQWFERYGPQIEGGYQLQPRTTATTVRWGADHKPIVTDGPFAEGGEVVGGYAIVKANDLDEILAIAKTWPAGSVEVRPVVER